MKLRNKKTGEVEKCEAITIQTDIRADDYYSLAELNEEWEDYKLAEPLIGDEATAKFVRAWAKHWGIEKVMARIRFDHGIDLVGWIEDSGSREIDIQGAFVSGEIKDCHEYTIDELCGEEEAPEPLEPSFIDLDERIREKEEE